MQWRGLDEQYWNVLDFRAVYFNRDRCGLLGFGDCSFQVRRLLKRILAVLA